MAKKRTLKEQKAMYKLWQQSGLTGAEFCRKNHISTRSTWKWRKEFGTADIINKDSTNAAHPRIIKDVKFYPIGKVDSNTHKDSLLEITLPNGANCKAHLSESGINIFLRELLK
jgi:hypothetical protein